MSSKVRTFLLSLTVIAVLIFSAIGPTIVYADDGAPPAGDGGRTGPPAANPSMTGVPENTSVAVLDVAGRPQPLATQAAAVAIATTNDPIWCPAGQLPGGSGCTAPYGSFTELLNALAGNPAFQGAGTIYVLPGAYTGSESSIDFNSFTLSNLSDLTIQGGWDTNTNTVTGTSNFTVPIIIGSSTSPWGGSLTINNIVITGAQSGLTLNAQNNITLSNVQVTDSVTGAGAELDAGGNVSINNSNFLRNNTAGAIISAGGNVAISTSEFSNTFNQRRQIKGLDITSAGSVSLFQVLAIGNRRVGTTINAGGRVTIGSSEFSETNGLNGGIFYGYGLQVVTPDAIDLSFVTANNNFLWGASLDAGLDVNISDSFFNNNSTQSPTFIDDTGLIVTSDGAVTLNRVEATGNRLIGAVINAAGIVTINDSTFSDNLGVTTTGTGSAYHGLGLGVVSLSNILLNNVTASGNGLTGASLSGANVTITNSTFSNNTTGSVNALSGNGLLVVGTGNVTLFNVKMEGNQVNGATIQATANTILDSVTASTNGGNGVEVNAVCTGVTNGTYSGNTQYGLFLTNPALSQSGSPVFANNGAGNIFPANPAPCTLLVSTGGGTGGGASTGNNTGSSTAASASNGGSSLQQAVSYAPVTQHDGTATSLLSASLNNLFTGITRNVTGNSIVTSIFVGNYVYVYTIYLDDSAIDNLQIIILP